MDRDMTDELPFPPNHAIIIRRPTEYFPCWVCAKVSWSNIKPNTPSINLCEEHQEWLRKQMRDYQFRDLDPNAND